MIKTATLAALLFCSYTSFAQQPGDTCSNNRFKPALNILPFSSVDSLQVTYGTATANIARIYRPVGDTNTCRPVIIWAHGGGFTGGGYNEQKTTDMMRQMARKGYVAITIEYRLWPTTPANQQEYQETMIRGVQDMIAAIRYAKANSASLGIDTSQVFIGGSSAGAIIANHAAYMDVTEAFPLALANQGGNLNVTTSPSLQGISAEVAGCVTQAGAIWDLTFLNNETTPWGAVHNSQDNVVPYNTGGGSFQIYTQLQTQSVPSHLKTLNQPGLHTPFPPNVLVDTFNLATYTQLYAMLKHNGSATISASGNTLTASPAGSAYQWYLNNAIIPGATSQTYHATSNGAYAVRIRNCNTCFSTSPLYNHIATGISELSAGAVNIYPVPSSGLFTLTVSQLPLSVSIYNLVGEKVYSQQLLSPSTEIDLGREAKGIYYYTIRDEKQVVKFGKLVIQ